MIIVHSLELFNDKSITVFKVKACTWNHKAVLKPVPALTSDLIDLDCKTNVSTWNGSHILQS